jgi:hypothetical protein
MARQKKTKTQPVVVHSRHRPDSLLSIQLRFKERNEGGKLTFKGSRALTVSGITLDEAYERILKAFRE